MVLFSALAFGCSRRAELVNIETTWVEVSRSVQPGLLCRCLVAVRVARFVSRGGTDARLVSTGHRAPTAAADLIVPVRDSCVSES